MKNQRILANLQTNSCIIKFFPVRATEGINAVTLRHLYDNKEWHYSAGATYEELARCASVHFGVPAGRFLGEVEGTKCGEFLTDVMTEEKEFPGHLRRELPIFDITPEDINSDHQKVKEVTLGLARIWSQAFKFGKAVRPSNKTLSCWEESIQPMKKHQSQEFAYLLRQIRLLGSNA
jgi:hypothetical protein